MEEVQYEISYIAPDPVSWPTIDGGWLRNPGTSAEFCLLDPRLQKAAHMYDKDSYDFIGRCLDNLEPHRKPARDGFGELVFFPGNKGAGSGPLVAYSVAWFRGKVKKDIKCYAPSDKRLHCYRRDPATGNILCKDTDGLVLIVTTFADLLELIRQVPRLAQLLARGRVQDVQELRRILREEYGLTCPQAKMFLLARDDYDFKDATSMQVVRVVPPQYPIDEDEDEDQANDEYLATGGVEDPIDIVEGGDDNNSQASSTTFNSLFEAYKLNLINDNQQSLESQQRSREREAAENASAEFAKAEQMRSQERMQEFAREQEATEFRRKGMDALISQAGPTEAARFRLAVANGNGDGTLVSAAGGETPSRRGRGKTSKTSAAATPAPPKVVIVETPSPESNPRSSRIPPPKTRGTPATKKTLAGFETPKPASGALGDEETPKVRNTQKAAPKSTAKAATKSAVKAAPKSAVEAAPQDAPKSRAKAAPKSAAKPRTKAMATPSAKVANTKAKSTTKKGRNRANAGAAARFDDWDEDGGGSVGSKGSAGSARSTRSSTRLRGRSKKD